MTPRRHHALSIALVLAAASVSCQSPRVWIEDRRTFDFDPAAVGALRCDTHNGGVRTHVDPGARQIAVVAAIRAGGMDDADARAALDAIELVHEVRAEELVLGWDWSERRSGWGAEVSFEVRLPAALPARVSTHNGSIEVTARDTCVAKTHNGRIAIAGEVREVIATSNNGSMRIVAPVRRLSATTHNGDLHLVCNGDGTLEGEVESHNGSVTLELAEGTSTTLRCSTHNGSISSAAPLHDIESGDDRLGGTLGAGGGTLRVTTHNGRIEIRGTDGGTPR